MYISIFDFFLCYVFPFKLLSIAYFNIGRIFNAYPDLMYFHVFLKFWFYVPCLHFKYLRCENFHVISRYFYDMKCLTCVNFPCNFLGIISDVFFSNFGFLFCHIFLSCLFSTFVVFLISAYISIITMYEISVNFLGIFMCFSRVRFIFTNTIPIFRLLEIRLLYFYFFFLNCVSIYILFPSLLWIEFITLFAYLCYWYQLTSREFFDF